MNRKDILPYAQFEEYHRWTSDQVHSEGFLAMHTEHFGHIDDFSACFINGDMVSPFAIWFSSCNCGAFIHSRVYR